MTAPLEHTPGEDLPSANAPAIAALVCNTPTCGHRGSFVQIHADTVLPVHCGGCYAVLHCAHRPETTVQGPSHDDPQHHTITACQACGSELGRESRDATPQELAALLPAGLRAALKHA